MLNIRPVYHQFNSNVVSFKGKEPPKISHANSDNIPELNGYQSNIIYYSFPISQITKLKNIINSKRANLLSHTRMDYNKWLEQFDTDSEKSLALKMLENYVYIDVNNARSAFRKLYLDLSKEIDVDNKTIFATLGIAKSGSYMGYLFRQANKLRSKGKEQHEFSYIEHLPKEEKFITSTQLEDVDFNEQQVKNGKENIVIIDDILGDGDSFTEYLSSDIYKSLKKYKNVYLLTLVKDPDGEKRIKEAFPDLNIQFRTAQEIYKYDSPLNTQFSDYEKVKISNMLNKYGEIICPDLVEKYSRSKLFVSFDWNTPGNTPMIFNITNSNWNGLFHRFNGLEEKDVSPEFNFFN